MLSLKCCCSTNWVKQLFPKMNVNAENVICPPAYFHVHPLFTHVKRKIAFDISKSAKVKSRNFLTPGPTLILSIREIKVGWTFLRPFINYWFHHEITWNYFVTFTIYALVVSTLYLSMCSGKLPLSTVSQYATYSFRLRRLKLFFYFYFVHVSKVSRSALL